jgi:small subunit ribosomal protein S7
MARRRRAERRVVAPDSRFGNVVVSRFINRLMWSGKRTTAQRIFYTAMDQVQTEAKREPLEVFEHALRNTTPMVEVRSRRVGGATYPIPSEVRAERGAALGMKWIIQAARSRKGKPMSEKLAQEILEASKGQGAAVKRREDLHRMAESNRAFAHYRW